MSARDEFTTRARLHAGKQLAAYGDRIAELLRAAEADLCVITADRQTFDAAAAESVDRVLLMLRGSAADAYMLAHELGAIDAGPKLRTIEPASLKGNRRGGGPAGG